MRDTFLLIISNVADRRNVACLLADQGSLAHDYLARQKIGGTHLKHHVKKQVTTLPQDAYSEADLDHILPRVLELAEFGEYRTQVRVMAEYERLAVEFSDCTSKH